MGAQHSKWQEKKQGTSYWNLDRLWNLNWIPQEQMTITQEKRLILYISSHYLNRTHKQDLLEKNEWASIPLLPRRQHWDLSSGQKKKVMSTTQPHVQHRLVSFPASLNWKHCLPGQCSFPKYRDNFHPYFKITVLLKEMCLIWDTTYAYADMVFRLKE